MKIDENRWCPGGSIASQPRSYSQLVGRNQTWLALLRSATWLADQKNQSFQILEAALPGFSFWVCCFCQIVPTSWWVKSPMLLQCWLNSNACVSCLFLTPFRPLPVGSVGQDASLGESQNVGQVNSFIHFLVIKTHHFDPFCCLDPSYHQVQTLKATYFFPYHVWIRIFVLHKSKWVTTKSL